MASQDITLADPVAEEKSKSIYDTCWYCRKVVGKAKVKRCANCRMVWYCSKDCQRKAWPTHKPRCMTGSNLWEQLANDPDGDDKAALHKDLTRWVATWRDVISTYAIHALDIANHGRQRINTHTILIELESRRNRSTRADMFRIVKASLLSQQEFTDWINSADILPEDLARVRENRGADTVQIALTCDGQALRFLWFQLRDNGESCERDKREFSAFMAKAWPMLLEAVINSGDPDMEMSEALAALTDEQNAMIMDMMAEHML